MYAVVQDRSRQLTVRTGDQVLVDFLSGAEPGQEHIFSDVRLLRTEAGEVSVGTPSVDGASVRASVVGHEKGPKLRVQYFNRRKGRNRTGHRQPYTRIQIEEIRA